MIRFTVPAAALLAAFASTASAAEVCGAATHVRYGETRAYFQDVLAACPKDRPCSFVSAQRNPQAPLGESHTLRVLLPKAGAPLDLALVSVLDRVDPADAGVLSWGAERLSLKGRMAVRDNVVNEYWLSDADADARRLIQQAREATWTYASLDGAPSTARFNLRGATRALAWMECMAKRPAG